MQGRLTSKIKTEMEVNLDASEKKKRNRDASLAWSWWDRQTQIRKTMTGQQLLGKLALNTTVTTEIKSK